MTERWLVTGAGGQLGTDVVAVAAGEGRLALGLGSNELDVTDDRRVREIVHALQPTAIIHCGAFTAVDLAEDQPQRALEVNGAGTANVARAARDVGAYLLTLSTDYVFPGDSDTGYPEDAPTGPVNAYGASKLAAEQATLELAGAAVARTAWLFGASGTNFVRTIARLAAERDAIDVVADQRGCPTYTRHLARALVTCVEQRLPGVLHLVGEPVATWYDLAACVVHELGSSCEVRETTSDRFPRPARRPACSVLLSTRPDTPPVGDWREGVREVVRAMALEPAAS